MTRTSLITTAAIITVALTVAGCQRRTPEPTPTSTPEDAEFPRATFAPLFGDEFATPSATSTPSATPTVTTNGQTTKGGQTLGTTTPKTTTKTTTSTAANLYEVSASSIEINLNSYQSKDFPITLKNNFNSQVMYAVKSDQKPSDTFPVGINGSNETTGTIGAFSTAQFNISTRGTKNASNFTTNITVNFVQNNKVAATKTIKVTVRTFVQDPITIETDNDANNSGDAQATINHERNRAYPIRIVNRYSRKIKWDAEITSGDVRGRLMNLSTTSGSIDAGGDMYTNIHFTDADLGSVNLVHVKFTFKTEDGTTLDTKTLELKINR